MKKLVVLGPSSERYKSGISQFLRYLVDCLAGDHEVAFYSWYQLYPPLLSRQFKDTTSKTETGQSKADFILGYMNPLSWLRFARRAKAENADIICLSWIHPVHAPIYLFLNFYFKRYCAAELVYICFNANPHESFPGAGLLSRAVLKSADRLIVHGKSEEQAINSLLGEAKITRLFLPFRDFYKSVETQAPKNQTRNGKHLLFFGIIRPYKGLDILLTAFSLVLEKHPDAHLTIAGERFYQKKKGLLDLFFQRQEKDPIDLVSELALEKSVTIDLRFIPNEEIPLLFELADVSVFPYRSATQSGVIAVSYGQKVPVIATRVGGLPDVIEEGQSGYLVEPENPAALAETIIRFIEKPITKEQVAEFAKSMSWDRYISGLLTGHSQDPKN